jgi:putative zinc finger/helix-turn-helix YgiT family protein
MDTKIGPHNYSECGLANVILVNVEMSRCRDCGETEVAILNVEGLHRAMAHAIIRKRARLVSQEIRFLRKYLGWSGVDFARHIGVAPETVSRWEQGTNPMGPTADRALRLMVARMEPMAEYPLDELKGVDRPTKSTVKLRMLAQDNDWAPEPVAA